jgi:hypothetical protein
VVVHRNESVLKNIFKRGYEEIRERKLLEILKKDGQVKQQDSTPQKDSTLGLKWIKKIAQNIV